MRLTLDKYFERNNQKLSLDPKQTVKLEECGLVNVADRFKRDTYGYTVEELFMILPEYIWVDDKHYALKTWTSAFGVLYVGYVSPKLSGDYKNDYLMSVGLDDVSLDGVTPGYLVDALYELLVELNTHHPSALDEVKTIIANLK